LKNFLAICFFLLGTIPALAQKRGNTWYFGRNIGLDFNQVPVRALNTSLLTSYEGTASISDNNGNVLFYTNGITVANREHREMLNGDGLFGSISSTNNTLIIPLPGSNDIYYVFTTGAAEERRQFCYSIVDMKGDGGLGEVTQKNNLIEDIIFEKLAAVRHCNNRDVWLTVRKWDSDEYHSYLLTSSGLSPVPVISNTGYFVGGPDQNNALGTLKFSADGKKFAAIHSFGNDAVELMDFDNTTGIISNAINFRANTNTPTNAFSGVYGAEFSPSGKFLYVSSNSSTTDPTTLYQFDISSGVIATILASKQVIAQASPWKAGALQAGPDGKIYMAMFEDSALSVIDNPDTYGAGCNFKFNEIKFQKSKSVQYGLPGFIATDFNANLVPYDFTRVGGNCQDPNVSFTINRLTGVSSVNWYFGDGQTSLSVSPTNTYASPGFYDVSLVIYGTNCSVASKDSITHSIWIPGNFTLLGNDTSACIIKDIRLGVAVTDVNYLWNTGETTDSITVNSPGKYWIQIEKAGCKAADTLNVTLKPAPFVNAGKDTVVCFNQGVFLNAGNATANSYLWNTGETTASIFVKTIGEYSVTVTENSCTAADTVVVDWGDCDIFIPSAFTPNGDTYNEKFGVSSITRTKSFFFQVFNKAGQPVFATSDINEKWDGTFKKSRQPMGAYVWILHYVNSKNERKFMTGTVMLIR
jgi:gliding motility-associated-like protein